VTPGSYTSPQLPADGVTEEAAQLAGLTSAELALLRRVQALEARPARSSQRKVVVACTALITAALVSVVLVIAGDADASSVMVGYGSIVTASLAVFGVGNAAEHAASAKPPYTPPPGWGPR